MNPSSVTMLGASHNGSSSTKAFHYQISALFHLFTTPLLRVPAVSSGVEETYIMLQYILRNQTLVHARIFITLQMHQRFFRYAFMRCLLYSPIILAVSLNPQASKSNILLLGTIAPCVTGNGNNFSSNSLSVESRIPIPLPMPFTIPSAFAAAVSKSREMLGNDVVGEPLRPRATGCVAPELSSALVFRQQSRLSTAK